MRVTLVSEGTYPFAMGGVSVWMDQLIRGMSDYSWDVVTLTVDGTERSLWERPGNLATVTALPLWGQQARRSAPVPPSYAEFLRLILTPAVMGQGSAAFLAALEDLSRCEDLLGALTGARGSRCSWTAGTAIAWTASTWPTPSPRPICSATCCARSPSRPSAPT
ncbi:DUF3492 domain-containing protein [Nonomuraea dietziae]|uniref:DUF3492 domain-containing protein n=1 Tax=Nonomuraea dietziae TaxID=65515 RepID=UPI00361723F9